MSTTNEGAETPGEVEGEAGDEAPVYSTPATVAVDARHIRDQTTGKGRYTRQVIENVLALDDSLRMRLVTHPSRPDPVDHERVDAEVFPAHPHSVHTRFTLGWWLDLDGVDLFHSPFNYLPKGLSVPAVFTLHDMMWLINPSYCTESWWNKWISSFFYEQVIPPSVHESRAIFTVSHNARQTIEDYFPGARGRVHVTYNGVDPFFEPMDPAEAWPLIGDWVPPRSRFVLIVGRGSPHKNHARAVESFIDAFEDDPETYLVLLRKAGRTPADRLQELLDHPEVGSRIVRLDYVSGRELRALYSMARIFLFPSLHEGFGLPILEAMACGTPVVTSNIGAPDEVAGDAGVCVDPESVDAIRAGLERLARDDDFWEDRRRAGLQRASEFTWRRCGRQTLEAYRQVLGLETRDPPEP